MLSILLFDCLCRFANTFAESSYTILMNCTALLIRTHAPAIRVFIMEPVLMDLQTRNTTVLVQLAIQEKIVK